MPPDAPFRPLKLSRSELQLEQSARGEYRLRVAQELGSHPARLCDRLVEFADSAPERSFLLQRDEQGRVRSISYREALASAQQLAAALLRRDLSAERPLVIVSENDLDHGLLSLAALYAGVPYAAISPAYSLQSRDYVKLRDAIQLLTPGLVFAADGTRYGAAIAASVPVDVPVWFARHPSRANGVLLDKALSDSAPLREVERARAAITPDTISKFLLTSGSTGVPKAVVHTQRMLTSNQQMLLECLPFLGDTPPMLVDWLPWHHTFGGNHNFGLTLWNGGTLFIDDGKPTRPLFGRTLKNLRELAPTVYFNVPRGFEELVNALERDDELARHFFSRVQMLFYAGASLSQPVWDRLSALAARSCGERIVMITGLGMTETSPFALCASWEAGMSGGIGVPAPGVSAKLAPVGDKLEVRYRGPSVTPGYWRQPELTRAAFDEDGYFKSGDAVRFADPSDPQRGLLFDGRVAEDFKLDTGTWVSVGPLRARVIAAGAPHVQDAVITGHDRSELGALIMLDEVHARALCSELPANAALAELAVQPKLRAALQSALDRLFTEATGSASRITRFLVVTSAPSLDKGEITDKGSLNQRAMLAGYAAQVERLHAPEAAQDLEIIFPST
jgi:feruloyl-CoA synthase